MSVSGTFATTNNYHCIITASATPIIVIDSTDALQPESILVHNAYGLDLTFNNLIIDGSLNTQSSIFLQTDTNQTTQINIYNSQMIGFDGQSYIPGQSIWGV
eukprot:141176_1